jgi:hypothetical protein
MSLPASLSALNRAELEALVVELMSMVSTHTRMIAELRAEIASLKGLKGPPALKPSGMENATQPPRPGKGEPHPRRGKIRPRVAIEERVLKAAAPAGSRFKGYETYLVQELVLSVHAVRYRRERWVTPDGQTIVAPLPAGISGHFGPGMRRFVLMQYHHGQSTLPRVTALLRSVGVSISRRQTQRLLTEGHDGFIGEARDVLRAGLATSPGYRWTTLVHAIAARTPFPAFRWRQPRLTETLGLHADRQ